MNNTEERQVLPLSFLEVGRRLETSGSNGSDLYIALLTPRNRISLKMYKGRRQFCQPHLFLLALETKKVTRLRTAAHQRWPILSFSGVSAFRLCLYRSIYSSIRPQKVTFAYRWAMADPSRLSSIYPTISRRHWR